MIHLRCKRLRINEHHEMFREMLCLDLGQDTLMRVMGVPSSMNLSIGPVCCSLLDDNDLFHAQTERPIMNLKLRIKYYAN